MQPIIPFGDTQFLFEMQPEPAETVRKFIVFLIIGIAPWYILRDKVACYESFQHLGEIAIRIDGCLAGYIIATETCMTFAQETDDLHTTGGIVENRIKQPLELITQFGLGVEE